MSLQGVLDVLEFKLELSAHPEIRRLQGELIAIKDTVSRCKDDVQEDLVNWTGKSLAALQQHVLAVSRSHASTRHEHLIGYVLGMVFGVAPVVCRQDPLVHLVCGIACGLMVGQGGISRAKTEREATELRRLENQILRALRACVVALRADCGCPKATPAWAPRGPLRTDTDPQ
jgi:hypothetical protein